MDDHDRHRFLQALYILNDELRPINIPFGQYMEKRQPFISIVSYCLMNNHFHLLIRQLRDYGVSKIMQKILNGYTKYFNARYKRTGRLFESAFKSVLVSSSEQLLHVSRYIHLNPISFIEPKWKERGIVSPDAARAYVEMYPWSSYRHFTDLQTNIIIDKKPIISLFSGKDTYQKFVEDHIRR